jgi:hypothetical protein
MWLQEQISVALAGESTWNPGVGIIEIPNNNTNALGDISAGLDRVVVILDLLSLCLLSWRKVEADVKLGDDDFDTEFYEGPLGLQLLVIAWGLAYIDY